MMGKNLRWMAAPLVVIVLACVAETTCWAVTYESLRDAKEDVWQGVISSDTKDSEMLEEELVIDGAVSETGQVKTMVGNWKSKAIPKEEEIKVYQNPEGMQIVGKLFSDTIASITSEEGDWFQIHSGYLRGYVRKSEVRTGRLAEKRANNTCPIQIMSNEADIKVMSEASRDSKVLNYVVQRQKYEIVEEENGWYLIQLPHDVQGYVSEEDVVRFREIHVGRTIEDMSQPQRLFVKEKVTEEERRLLAAIIFCEAAGESFEGQKAVATVVFNRVKSEDYPNTIKEVIYEKNQFEPVLTKKLDYVLENDSVITQSCYEAADATIQGSNSVGDVLFFRIGGPGIQIGVHGFY